LLLNCQWLKAPSKSDKIEGSYSFSFNHALALLFPSSGLEESAIELKLLLDLGANIVYAEFVAISMEPDCCNCLLNSFIDNFLRRRHSGRVIEWWSTVGLGRTDDDVATRRGWGTRLLVRGDVVPQPLGILLGYKREAILTFTRGDIIPDQEYLKNGEIFWRSPVCEWKHPIHMLSYAFVLFRDLLLVS